MFIYEMDKHNFICPLTNQIFSDPVICDDGNIYERDAINTWLLEHNASSPITRQQMSSKLITVNFLKSMIDEFLIKNPELKSRQYIALKDFKRYINDIMLHIKSNEFEKLLEYTNYIIPKMQTTIKIKINDKDVEITYFHYFIKTCKDEKIIDYVLTNSDKYYNFLVHIAQYCTEELNMKYSTLANDNFMYKTHKKWTALHFYAKRGFSKAIEKINTTYTLNSCRVLTEKKYTPLKFAIKYNHLDIINIFINSDMDIQTPDIIFALKYKISYDIIKQMYLKCSNNSKDKINLTQSILKRGRYKGYKEFIKFMLDNIETYMLNEIIKDNNILATICHIASTDIIKMFVDKGFSVNILDDKGVCAWMILLQNKRWTAFKYMIPKIDFSTKSKTESTMIHFLAQNAPYQLIKEMTDLYQFDYNEIADDYTPLLYAIEYNRSSVCRLLLEKGADVNIKLKKSHIMHAAEHKSKDFEFIKLIMSKCNNLEEECDGWYPIHNIAINGTPEVVKYWIDLNINIEVKSKFNHNLLHCLCDRTDCEDLIKYLIEVKKVNIDQYDNVGFKPIHYTYLKGSFDMIKYMKKITKDHAINFEVRKANRKIFKKGSYFLDMMNYNSLTELMMQNPNVKEKVKSHFSLE